jgi:tetratricopeptide (TPR) repeat protein
MLRQLADVCLLEEHRPGRYVVHDLVRAFGVDRSFVIDTAAKRAAALDRWYEWCIRRVTAAAPLIYPTYEPLPTASNEPGAAMYDNADEAMAWLDAEWSNIRAAIRHAAEHGPRSYAWFLVHAVRGYLLLRRNIVDWDSTARAALTAADADGDPHGLAAAHQSLGALYTVQDDHQPAIDHLTAALDHSRHAGWLAGEAAASSNLGMIYWQAGQLDAARSHLDRALGLYRQLSRPAGETAVLTKLGTVHSAAGRLEQAAQAYREALDIDAHTGSRVARAHNNNNLGNAYHALGRLDASLAHLTTALHLAVDNGDRGLQVNVGDSLAAALCTYGRYGPAMQHATTCLRLARDIGDRWNEAHVLNTLGTIHFRLGDSRTAIEHHQQALQLASDTGSGVARTAALVGLTHALRSAGRPVEALDTGRSALNSARAGYRVLEGHAHTAIARAYLETSDPPHAIEHARRALAIYGATGHILGEADATEVLGDAQQRAGNQQAAKTCRARQRRLYAKAGLPERTPHTQRHNIDPCGPDQGLDTPPQLDRTGDADVAQR